MRILSKSSARATVLALGLLVLSCSQLLPRGNEPMGEEVNLAFTLEQNLIQLQTVRIDNRDGRFILGSAAPRTIVDPRFRLRRFRSHGLQISEKESLRISPAPRDLGGVADAIIGVEAWRNKAISIDYHSGLVTYQKDGIKPGLMQVYRFPAEPMINVNVNGREVAAIVDTTSPDTLILPGSVHGRGTVKVSIGTTDFGAIDVQYANVAHARVGNRLLSRFLVTIDYGRRVVGLWRDPRIPLESPSLPVIESSSSQRNAAVSAAGQAASSPPRRTQARDACGPAGEDAGVPLAPRRLEDSTTIMASCAASSCSRSSWRRPCARKRSTSPASSPRAA